MNQNRRRAVDHRTGWHIVKEILEETEGRKCVFRGEPEQYEKCSSSLYRKIPEGMRESRYASSLQKMYKDLMVEDARRHVDFWEEEDVLAKVRHYGGFTGWIDFTGNCLVALFFACRSDLDKDGRLIILPKACEGQKYVVRAPKIKDSRALMQSSVFIDAPKGRIDDEDMEIIPIRHEHKEAISDYLSKLHDVSEDTLFDDLHGVIERQGKILEATLPFYRGLQADERGDWNESVERFTEAININPRFPLAYSNRGSAYSSQGNYERAVADYGKAIEMDPKLAEAYFHRGNTHGSQGDYERAVADYGKAIEMYPEFAGAYNNRGRTYSSQGNYEQAVADYGKAIELDPEYAEAYNNRGSVYSDQGSYEQAVADYGKAIELDPGYAEAYCNRGKAYRLLNKREEAMVDYEECERLAQEQNLSLLLTEVRGIKQRLK